MLSALSWSERRRLTHQVNSVETRKDLVAALPLEILLVLAQQENFGLEDFLVARAVSKEESLFLA